MHIDVFPFLRAASCVLLLNTCAAPSIATPTDAALLADCDAQSVRVTVPTAQQASDARAVWINATQIHWPGRPNTGRFRLYHANDGTISALLRQKVSGAQASSLLSQQNAAGANIDPRFAYLGKTGVLLSARDLPVSTLQTWLQGQLLLVHEDDRARVLDVTSTQPAAWLDAVYAAARQVKDLGVTMRADNAQFAVWAPTARSAAVCIYQNGEANASQRLAMQRDQETGVWRARSAEKLDGQSYRFALDVYARGLGRIRNLVSDPYAISLNANGDRSVIADLNDPALMPEGWSENVRGKPLASATDMVIYELHVRDFSATDSSVGAAHRGKFSVFTQTDSDAMQHLKSLAQAGLSDVHLLPVFDFATVPEVACESPEFSSSGADSDSARRHAEQIRARDCFNWGYDPKHFGAPEGSYASDARDGSSRIIEFRAMVDALHRIGLRVGMDVVYNHTSHAGQHPDSVLDRIVPDYYHRLSSTGEVERSTCCDNTATEHAMMAKLMIDTAERWVRDYRIDSFRFDLMGHQPLSEMRTLQKAVDAAAGRTIHLLGEGWNFGEVANNQRFVQAAQNNLTGSGIASFSDRARDAARGGGCCDSGRDLIARQGYLNGLHYAPNALNTEQDQRVALLKSADMLRVGLAGSLAEYSMLDHTGKRIKLSQLDYAGQAAGYVAEPGEVVNYVENHDNPTLFDINALRLPADTSSAERARVQTLGTASVLFSQGIAYLHAGQEILRSKSLDRNSYDSGDWFNRIDWTLRDNAFASGLPLPLDNPQQDALIAPVLSNPSIKPSPADIQFARDRALELLRVRASTSLLRLPSAAHVLKRLQFFNVGPSQISSVLAAHIDGRDIEDLPLPGANFKALVYLINVDTKAHALALPQALHADFVLHPALAQSDTDDARRDTARYDPESGTFHIPPRSALVFVQE